MRLNVIDIGCRRADMQILSGVNFGVAAGQALILRGPNGSGKTTLLRTLAGLTPAVDGEIQAPADAFAYAGHADGIKAQLSVAENLWFWARVFGTGDIEPAIAMFDLGALRDRQAQHLSAGQKRRLGLSRLLVTGRPIWMLDEPTVSLDAANVKIFARMIEKHLSGGGIAVIATHIDLGLADAKVLDISEFRSRADDHANPFLDGVFS